ncbi:hypothetical protein HH214_01125 [Mucilaginibacter robiniae]|uniref:Uncharacterized protein n=1 Tax=Mucilaginibacter robiniae TaxID=2728022 RepID=A0A7L5E174_9SPHI|nr:hypothetical protein [Mucilaginibacter robiniae]QJD94573.1 hypothetical protein HH214_01125 [Mucilaginibacter robiniae]
MGKPQNIEKDISRIQHTADGQTTIDNKLDELVALLDHSELDSEKIKALQQRLNGALDNLAASKTQSIDAFKHIQIDENASRAELLDEFSVLLSGNQLDSKMAKEYIRGERLSKLFLMFIGLVMVALGFAMIIMPAPPYFEMFTIYYFSPDDGVTLMDLISLLIILSGIFLIIRSMYKKSSTNS